MKCPNCGSGRNQKQRLGGWLERYTCLECQFAWQDQIEAIPDRNVRDPVKGTTEFVRGERER